MHKLLKPSTHTLVDTRSTERRITEDLSGPSYLPSILPSCSYVPSAPSRLSPPYLGLTLLPLVLVFL